MTESVETDAATTDIKKSFSPKSVARFVVGNSVKFAVTSSLMTLVPTETKTEKVKLLIASYALSGLVAEKAKSYITDDIDEKIEFLRDVRDELKKLKTDKD